MIWPGASPWAPTPSCCRWPLRSCPEGKLSPSWMPRPPDAWRPSSSFSPLQGGMDFFFFLLLLFVLVVFIYFLYFFFFFCYCC